MTKKIAETENYTIEQTESGRIVISSGKGRPYTVVVEVKIERHNLEIQVNAPGYRTTQSADLP